MAPSMKPRHTTLTKPSTRGGRKRKIPIEKIVDKAATAVTYSKRTGGLYSKASQLCLLDSSQIAIIATPPSSDSNLSFYSFAHHSADALVSAYLSGQSLGPVPSDTTKQMREDVAICLARKDLGLGFWWEEDLPDTLQGLSQSWSSMRNLMTNLEGFCGELAIDHQTLTSHSDPICCVPRDHHQTQVPDQTLILDCFTNKDTELIDPQQQNQVCDSFGVSENTLTTNLDVCNTNSEMFHSSLSHDVSNDVFSGKAHQHNLPAASNTNNIRDNEALPNSDGWSSDKEMDVETIYSLFYNAASNTHGQDHQATDNDQELDVETIYSLFYDHLVSDNSHQDLLVDDEVSMMETTNPLLFSDFGDFVEDGAPLLCGLDDFDDDHHCSSDVFTNIAAF